MMKRWCSIKEIEACLLCKTLISKDKLQGKKYCCEHPYAVTQKSNVFFPILEALKIRFLGICCKH